MCGDISVRGCGESGEKSDATGLDSGPSAVLLPSPPCSSNASAVKVTRSSVLHLPLLLACEFSEGTMCRIPASMFPGSNLGMGYRKCSYVFVERIQEGGLQWMLEEERRLGGAEE